MPEGLAHLLHLLKSFPVFAGVGQDQLMELAAFSSLKTINSNNVLIEEGKKPKYFYLLVSGSFSVVSRKQLTDKIVYDTVYPGEIIGELPLFYPGKRTASVIARSPAVVIAIPIQRFQELANKNVSCAKVLTAIAKNMARRLTATKKNYETIYKSFHHLNDSMIFNITFISSFIFIVPIIKLLHENFSYHQTINTLVIAFLGLATVASAKYAKVPWKDLGITLENWRSSVLEGVVFSLIAFIFLFMLNKLVLYFYPDFTLAGLFHEQNNHKPSYSLFVAISIYSAFSCIQEFIARGCFQGPMSKLLMGKHTELKAIIISNLLFSSFHVIYSYPLALVTFFPGLFWGWLYSRNKNLIGVSLSHALLGSWALFFA